MTNSSRLDSTDNRATGVSIGDIQGGIHDSLIAGRDIHIHKGEEIYDVRGLPNPYLGLRAFTYDERGGYAGRTRMVDEAVRLLTTPGEQRTLFFITGTSGSGKSSFAQAGLLPTLETYYQQRNQIVRWAVFRPSRQPLANLADALLRVGRPAEHTFADASKFIFTKSAVPASDNQITLLVIDQFEELFTQSIRDQRESLFALLQALPDFAELRVHIIATMRIDYLPELFAQKAIYDIAKQGLDLRAMSVDELMLAIQQPLQHAYPQGEKRFETALLEKLAKDTAEDAAYLPLLQVTLEDIWRRGRLQLSAYGELTDAVQQRAEQVYAYRNNTNGQPVPRSETEQKAILQIFLDLVEVSLSSDQRHDVRRRRPVQDVIQDRIEWSKLIEELAENRLLSRGLETRSKPGEETEVVDIIHESLIVNWTRLQAAIGAKRDVLQQRTRFEYALKEWLSEGHEDAYLLEGVRLAEAETLDRDGDVALQSEQAQQLLKRSIDHHEARRQQELNQARRRALALGAAFSVALLAFIATGFFFVQAQRNATQSQELVDAMSILLDVRVNLTDTNLDKQVAVLLLHKGLAMQQAGNSQEAQSALQQAQSLLPGLPSDYVWIPPGPFMMGSNETDKDAEDDEKPLHEVRLAGFWIMRTEVTNAQYRICVTSKVCDTPTKSNWDVAEFSKQPVTDVDWNQATTYANWVGGRLPTEAEWERACRGTDGRIYPWGNEPSAPNRLNYGDSGLGAKTDVGSYLAGANGLHDMAGNVWEWTADWLDWEYYKSSPIDNPSGNQNTPYRTVRGGSFRFSGRGARCADRDWGEPGKTYDSIGFRVVISFNN